MLKPAGGQSFLGTGHLPGFPVLMSSQHSYLRIENKKNESLTYLFANGNEFQFAHSFTVKFTCL